MPVYRWCREGRLRGPAERVGRLIVVKDAAVAGRGGGCCGVCAGVVA